LAFSILSPLAGPYCREKDVALSSTVHPTQRRLAIALFATLACLPLLVIDMLGSTSGASEAISIEFAVPDSSLVMEATPDTAAAQASVVLETTTIPPPTTVRIVPVPTTSAPRVVQAPTTTTTTSRRATTSPNQWDRLAACETGGNWAANSGNGYGGGLQFAHSSRWSTWSAFGGEEFTAHPWEASREQQIVIGERVLASQGWNAWPGCSSAFR
jgi:hypothetical protein